MTDNPQNRGERLLQAAGDDLAEMPVEEAYALVQDLRIHQLELERQDEELRREAEARLQRSVDRQTADLRMLSARLIDAHDRERRRIAAGLHDDIGQMVAACRLALDQAGGCADEVERAEVLATANGLLNEVADSIRALTFELDSNAVFVAGLGPAVGELCRKWAQQSGVSFHVFCPEDFDAPETPRPVLYRCGGELLRNIIQHSGAGRAGVRLEVEPAASAPGPDASGPSARRLLDSAPGRGTTAVLGAPLP